MSFCTPLVLLINLSQIISSIYYFFLEEDLGKWEIEGRSGEYRKREGIYRRVALLSLGFMHLLYTSAQLKWKCIKNNLKMYFNAT